MLLGQRSTVAVLAASLTTLVAAGARAEQAATPSQDGEFSVQRFEPVPGPRNFHAVAGGRTLGDWTWSAAMVFDYQRNPFIIRSCHSATDCSSRGAGRPDDIAVVSDMVSWSLLGSLTPIPRLQLGLRLPVVYAAGQGLDLTTGGPSSQPIATAALGDVSLEGKVRVWGEPTDPLVLAGAIDLAAPTGHATAAGAYVGGDSPVTVGLRAIVDASIERLSLAGNLRGVFRSAASMGDSTVGSELRYGAAAGYRASDVFMPFVEGFGSTAFQAASGSNTLEAGVGLRIFPPAGPAGGQFAFSAAGSTGLIQGIGVPLARAVIGVSFAFEHRDEDGDGVVDDQDGCPTRAEDHDGVADDDGCPEDDFDHDKIPDDIDRCPLQPESDNRYQDDDGCPDEATDSDGDGFNDEIDRCPDSPGKLLDPEHLGCADEDADGVMDGSDTCPKVPEDPDGFHDEDGCPDLDDDGDGVLDEQDHCRNEPETVNGFEDEDGCPDEVPAADPRRR